MSDLQNLSAPLWTGEEALAALSGLGGQGDREWQANGVSIDTRNLKSGDLFVALPGEKADGHDYVESAFAAGASAALVRQGYTPPQGLPDAAAFIYVDDVAAGLEALGQAARARSQAHILAVTGSVGKPVSKRPCALLCRNPDRPMRRRNLIIIILACRFRWRACRARLLTVCLKLA